MLWVAIQQLPDNYLQSKYQTADKSISQLLPDPQESVTSREPTEKPYTFNTPSILYLVYFYWVVARIHIFENKNEKASFT